MATDLRNGLDAIELMARLDGCLYPLQQLLSQLDDIEELDRALEPELSVVRASIASSAEALRRAVRFVHVRYDVGNEAA